MSSLHPPAILSGPSAAAPTMSSREIAELLNSRHDNVKRAIERLAERAVITLPPLEEVSNDGPGPRSVTEYRVGKRDSYVIVAQLSPEFTARLVDRWQELEAGAATSAADTVALLSDPVVLQRLLLDNVGKVVALQVRVAELAPKADFCDAVSAAVNCHDMMVVAKELGTGRTRLFARLRRESILMDGNLPYQRYVDAGYFRVIEQTPWRDKHGNLHQAFKTLVTGKGKIFIQRLLARPDIHRDIGAAAADQQVTRR